MPQEDNGASELNHPEEILWVVFPANDRATKIMQPSKQSFDFPTAAVATQSATILSRGPDAHKFVRRDELPTVACQKAVVQRIAVVSAATDHSLVGYPDESLARRGFDEFFFMRRSL